MFSASLRLACIELDNQQILDQDYELDFVDGKLLWRLGSSGDQDQEDGKSGSLREDEIVFVCRESGSDDARSPNAYAVYSVRERPATAGDDQNATGPYYRLCVLSAPRLPQPLLDRHLLEAPPRHLVGGGEDSLHVIISTRSGTGLAEAVYESVLQRLFGVVGLRVRGSHGDAPPLLETQASSSSPSYSLSMTKSRHTIRELAQERWSTKALQGRSPQVIVLLSGDGGLVDILNGADDENDGNRGDGNGIPLSSTPPPTIALLPLGTGNALFHSLHRPLYKDISGTAGPSNLVVGLRTLFRGVAAPLPTFRATFSPGSTLVPPHEDDHGQGPPAPPQPVQQLVGAIVASYGFHAQLVWESDTVAYRKHGAKRFGMAAAELLRTPHAYQATVQVRGVDDGDLAWSRVQASRPRTAGCSTDDSTFAYVLATLVSNLEKTFTISPASRPLDGQLRLVTFGDVGAEKTMELMHAAYNDGAHVRCAWPSRTDDNDDQDAKPDYVVGYREADEIMVSTAEEDPRWRKVCIDGIIVEIPCDGWMRIKNSDKSRLHVLVDASVVPT